MSATPVVIAMWSGPRNLSTALMYSFANRADCIAWDEPFYAAYLQATAIDHPLRDAVLAACERDPATIARRCLEPPRGASLAYQKHMTHHMLDGFPLDWMDRVRNAFLIRSPESVVASYEVMRADMVLADLGFVRQRELFERVADRRGNAPPVIDADAIRADPRGTLGRLCAALDIAFDEAMLAWPAGPKRCDGPWAAHWYDAVHRSTGFAPPGDPPVLDARRARLAERAHPFYEALARYAV